LYYAWIGDEELASCAGAIREAGIAGTRRSPALGISVGVNPTDVEKLASAGIANTEEMLEAGGTPAKRQALAQATGLPLETILEFVKLSDLARIPGIARIRARLYHDAGADTLDNLATWDPDALRQMLVEFVERTGFEGIAPLPQEAEFTVDKASKLPKLVEW
jgi:predicted RecB family nuclease